LKKRTALATIPAKQPRIHVVLQLEERSEPRTSGNRSPSVYEGELVSSLQRADCGFAKC
jgi:hypothetical protein